MPGYPHQRAVTWLGNFPRSQFSQGALYTRIDNLLERSTAIVANDAWEGHPGALYTSLRNRRQLRVDTLATLRPFLRPDLARITILTPRGKQQHLAQMNIAKTNGFGETKSDRGDDRAPPEALTVATPLRVLAGMRRETLANGMQIAVLRREGLPIVHVRVAFHGGAAGAENAPLASYAASVRRRLHLWEQPFHFLSSQIARDDADVELYWSASSETNALLGAVAALGSATPDWSTLAALKRYAPVMQAKLETPSMRAQIAFEQKRFPQHPYGPSFETLQPSDADIDDWLRRERVGANGLVVIVGDVDPEAVLLRAKNVFGDFSRGTQVAKPPPLQVNARGFDPKDAVIAYDDAASLVELRLGCAVSASADTARLAADFLHGRAFSALRSDSGVAYDPSARSVAKRGGIQSIDMQATLRADRLAHGLGAALEAWNEASLSPEQLAAAQWRIMRNAPFGLATSDHIASALVDAWARDEILESAASEHERMMRITPIDVNQVLQRCRANTTLSLVGPRGSIADAYKERFNSLPPAPIP